MAQVIHPALKPQALDLVRQHQGAALGVCRHHFAVGITNSAPLPMLSGQRCITLFCLV
jgi:hypothetical protein